MSGWRVATAVLAVLGLGVMVGGSGSEEEVTWANYRNHLPVAFEPGGGGVDDEELMPAGTLGPDSNAHGPNELLHLPTGRRVWACVAQVLDAHANRPGPSSAT